MRLQLVSKEESPAKTCIETRFPRLAAFRAISRKGRIVDSVSADAAQSAMVRRPERLRAGRPRRVGARASNA